MPCISPIDIFVKSAGHSYPVPCNRCDECLNRRKMSYVYRIQQEAMHGIFKYRYFITLTYKDSYLPYESYSRKLQGSPLDSVSTGESLLCPYDLSQFFKRYRLFSGDKVRYFACGEYGSESNTHRPHFHIVLFCNHDWKTCKHYCELSWSYLVAESLEDRKRRYKLAKKLKRPVKRDSRHMSNRDLIGRVNIVSVTYRRMCYVAKYCNKALYKDEIVPPFVRLSNGLGDGFLSSDTAELCKSQNRHYSFFENGLPVALPRYYSHKLFTLEQMDSFNMSVIMSSNPPDFKSSEVFTSVDDEFDGQETDYFVIRHVNPWDKINAWYKAFAANKEIARKRSRLARYGLIGYYG